MKQLLTAVLVWAGLTAFAQGYQIGSEASDFSLKNIDGKIFSLKDIPEAKGYVVVFTCNHCPFAVATEERFVELDKKYKKFGYPVIAINPNDPEIVPGDSFEEMQKRAKAKGYTFPYLFDEKQEIYPVYGATKTPHVYVLEKKDGKLIVQYIGTIDDSPMDASAVKEKYLANAIDALLAGTTPNPQVTKAIGCSIKVKK